MKRTAAPVCRPRDWLVSLGLHGLMLAAAALSAWHGAGAPAVQQLDLAALQWAGTEPPAPAPSPTPIPVPKPAAHVVPRDAQPRPSLQALPAPRPVAPPPAAPPPVTNNLDTAAQNTVPYAAAHSPATAAAPAAEARPAPVSAAPTQRSAEVATPAPDTGAERRWQSHLEGLLARDRHYPVSARRARQEGVVLIEAHFVADGQMTRCAIHASSGFSALDEAALAMVRRAAEAARAHHAPGRTALLRIPITFQLEES